MAELETKLVQARTDSKAQVKGHNTGKKELEVSTYICVMCVYCNVQQCQACVSHQLSSAQCSHCLHKRYHAWCASRVAITGKCVAWAASLHVGLHDIAVIGCRTEYGSWRVRLSG